MNVLRRLLAALRIDRRAELRQRFADIKRRDEHIQRQLDDLEKRTR